MPLQKKENLLDVCQVKLVSAIILLAGSLKKLTESGYLLVFSPPLETRQKTKLLEPLSLVCVLGGFFW